MTAPWFVGSPLDGDRSVILAAAVATSGIARALPRDITTPENGGGDLNGSSAFIMLGQAGTAGQQGAVPRASAGNYTGVV
jgi:hypothetical protein